MNEKLIAGYTAYTTADEFGTAASSEAPASVETITISIVSATVGVSISETVQHGC